MSTEQDCLNTLLSTKFVLLLFCDLFITIVCIVVFLCSSSMVSVVFVVLLIISQFWFIACCFPFLFQILVAFFCSRCGFVCLLCFVLVAVVCYCFCLLA